MWLFDGARKRRDAVVAKFVPPQVLKLLNAGRIEELTPQVREISILSTDLIRIVEFTESLGLEEMWDFVRRSAAAMEEAIRKHDGVLDTWFGGALLAYWSVPTATPDHQSRACLALLDAVTALEKLTGKSPAHGGPAITAGISSGKVVAGVMEFGQRLRYTALGDEVSLATRIQGANTFFGTRLLISDSVYEGARDQITARFLGTVRVPDQQRTVGLYELIGRKEAVPLIWTPFLADFAMGVGHYNERRFELARKAFRLAKERMPADKPTQLYLAATEDYCVSPPPEGWEPTFTFTAGKST